MYSNHPDLTWNHIVKCINKDILLININSICKHIFYKDKKYIENKSKLKWQAKCKIENWLFECYWNPKSTFRIKKNNKYYLESIDQSTSSTVAEDSCTEPESVLT